MSRRIPKEHDVYNAVTFFDNYSKLTKKSQIGVIHYKSMMMAL
jgi:hypothetical protein